MTSDRVVVKVQEKFHLESFRRADWNNGILSFTKSNGEDKFPKEVSAKVFEKLENVGTSMTFRHPHLLYVYDHLSDMDLNMKEFDIFNGLCVVERGVPDLMEAVAARPKLFFSKKQVSAQLKKNIRGLVNALSLIQALGMVHGNIHSESTWSIHSGKDYFLIKLNILGDPLHGAMIMHNNSEVELKKDWYDLGNTFLRILEQVRICDAEQRDIVVVEFEDLCRSMMEGDFESTNMKKSLLRHPFFWGDERFSLLVNFCNVVKAENLSNYVDLSSEADNIKPPNPWTSMVNQKLLRYMNSNKEGTGGYDGTSAWDYLLFMRNILEHFVIFPDEVKGLMGRSREQILHVFIGYQPNTILALWRLTRKWIDDYRWCLKDICRFVN